MGVRRLRLSKIDELQFFTCLQHGLWGSRTNRFGKWADGDYLALVVGRELAGLAVVVGAPFVAGDRVWRDDVYPFRIPITFKYAASRQRRLPMSGSIGDALVEATGGSYGFLLVTQRAVSGEHAERIIREALSAPNDLDALKENLERLLEEAAVLRSGANRPTGR